MLDLVGLGTVATAFFVAAASPGPATIGVATVAMSGGRARGLRFGMGLSVGLSFWGLVAATGLGAILQASVVALTILKIVGGLYLLWLALGAARSAAKNEGAMPEAEGAGSDFKRGLLLNLSNPKAVFAWMATLALDLSDRTGTSQVALSTTLCMALGVAIYSCYAIAFSTLGVMGVYTRMRRVIEGAIVS